MGCISSHEDFYSAGQRCVSQAKKAFDKVRYRSALVLYSQAIVYFEQALAESLCSREVEDVLVNAYLQQAFNTESHRAMYTQEQLDIVANTPTWVTAAFAIAVFAGFFGFVFIGYHLASDGFKNTVVDRHVFS